jgi:5'/3'-nucleotidase SurE
LLPPRWLGRTVRAAALALGLAAAALACAPAPMADDASGELRILLTNDDGYDAPGLRVLQAALEAAGHRVTVVAPSVNQSGKSVALTTGGSLSYRRIAPDLYAVDGTPADCVRIALTTLLDEMPQLVVSGVNFGQNDGAGTISSGTVGAALTAALLGFPAIAVSQAVDPSDVRNTVRFFPDAADFAVALVRALVARGESPLLPGGIALNVNHPARKRNEVAGVRLTRQGTGSLYSLVYERQADGQILLAFAPSTTREATPDADTTALAEGYVSVTPLDGSWTAPEASFESFRPLVRELAPRGEGGAR